MNTTQKKSLAIPILFLFIIGLLFVAMVTSQGESDFFKVTGIWSILPPLIAISLAFATKNVVVSLFVGVLSGTLLISINGYNVLGAGANSFILATTKMQAELSDKWNSGVILQVLTIGGLVALITKLGGARAIATSLSKKATGPASAQFVTWLLGLIIFFDDYANALIVGSIMKPITDKNRISREKLAFIIDATAAPVAGIALISTWIGAEISTISKGLEIAGITNIAPYNLFVSTIPFRFYNILMLFFVVVSAVTMKDFGLMLKAETKARNGILPVDVVSDGDKYIDTPVDKPNILTALIPLSILIFGAFIGFYFNGRAEIIASNDTALIEILKNPLSFDAIRECFGKADASIVLFQSALLACIVAIFMGTITKSLTFVESIGTWLSGVQSLVVTCVILILAWTLSSSIKELGTASFLVTSLSSSTPAFILPGTIFVLGSIISFATGTSYGTMGILMPLAIPFAQSLVPNDSAFLIACTSAVLTGAIFGDHCSPISDTTILSSMGAKCDHMAHVNTQTPYALSVAAIAIIFGYLPLGFGVSIWIVLPLSLAVTFCLIWFVGKKPIISPTIKSK